MRKGIFYILLSFWILSISLTPSTLHVLGMTCLSSGKTQWRIQDNFSCCKPSDSQQAKLQARCCEFIKIQIKTDKEKPVSVSKIILPALDFFGTEWKPQFRESGKRPVWNPDHGPPLNVGNSLAILSRYNI